MPRGHNRLSFDTVVYQWKESLCNVTLESCTATPERSVWRPCTKCTQKPVVWFPPVYYGQKGIHVHSTYSGVYKYMGFKLRPLPMGIPWVLNLEHGCFHGEQGFSDTEMKFLGNPNPESSSPVPFYSEHHLVPYNAGGLQSRDSIPHPNPAAEVRLRLIKYSPQRRQLYLVDRKSASPIYDGT